MTLPCGQTELTMSTKAPTLNKGTDTGAKVELTTNEKYHILANERRRLTLAILLDHGNMSKGELGERVAARENNKTRTGISASERKSALVSLHQNHLEKLEGAGALIWDCSGTNRVYVGPTLEEFAQHVPCESHRSRVARAASALGF